MVEESVHLMVDRQRERGGDWEPVTVFKNKSPVTSFLQLGPTSHTFHNIPK
jgi:hypothetical protein